MRIKETPVFKFDELSDAAKDTAREWFRKDYPDCGWWDSVYEDACVIADLFGLDIDGGKNGPNINFSGFWTQGDGARFYGNYGYKAGAVDAVKAHTPEDTELHAIVGALEAAQASIKNTIHFKITRRGNYEHSGCMEFDSQTENYISGLNDDFQAEMDALDSMCVVNAETAAIAALRSFADWIYKSLETEHDWLTADEQVDESIRINEYEFDSGGEIQ